MGHDIRRERKMNESQCKVLVKIDIQCVGVCVCVYMYACLVSLSLQELYIDFDLFL